MLVALLAPACWHLLKVTGETPDKSTRGYGCLCLPLPPLLLPWPWPCNQSFVACVLLGTPALSMSAAVLGNLLSGLSAGRRSAAGATHPPAGACPLHTLLLSWPHGGSRRLPLPHMTGSCAHEIRQHRLGGQPGSSAADVNVCCEVDGV